LFQSPPWLAALRDGYGLSATAYVATDGAEEPIAGVAYCEVADVLGCRLLSLPFSDACDPPVRTVSAWDLLFDRLAAHGAPLRLRCLDNAIPRNDRRLTVVRTARWHTLPILATEEAQWAALAGPTRRSIRKAQRAGLEIRPLAGPHGGVPLP